MTLAQYLRYWEAHDQQEVLRDTPCEEDCDGSRLLYLKDWHFIQ